MNSEHLHLDFHGYVELYMVRVEVISSNFSHSSWRAQLSIQSSKPKFWGDFWLLSLKKNSVLHRPANANALTSTGSSNVLTFPKSSTLTSLPYLRYSSSLSWKAMPTSQLAFLFPVFLPSCPFSTPSPEWVSDLKHISDCGTVEPKSHQQFPMTSLWCFSNSPNPKDGTLRMAIFISYLLINTYI